MQFSIHAQKIEVKRSKAITYALKNCDIQKVNLPNLTVQLSHIPQCTIWCIVAYMGQVHCGICECDLLLIHALQIEVWYGKVIAST